MAETLELWRDWVPPGSPPRRTSVAIALGVGLYLLRRPSAISSASLWAEDGTIFLSQSLERGWRAVNDSYAGYLHIAPRLLAMVASWLPFRWTPVVYALVSAVVTVACCSPVLSRRSSWLLPTWGARVAVFAGLICLPRVAELHATLTNVIWWCGIGLLLVILLDDPSTTVGKVSEATAVALLVLSGANGVVLAPFVVFRWWRTRSIHSLVIAGVWWAAAGIQGWVLIHAERSLDGGDLPWPVTLIRWSVERTLGPFVLSGPYVDRPANLLAGFPLAAQVLILVAALMAAVVLLGGHRPSTTILLVGVAAASCLAGFMSLGPAAPLLPERYTAIPAAALLIGLISARPSRRIVAAFKCVLLVWIVVARPLDFSITPRPVLKWGPGADCVERHIEDRCVIPLNPPVDPGVAPWQVVVDSDVAR